MPFGAVAASWPIIVNLLAGSLLGAWFGAGWATRLRSQTLYRVIAIMLGLIAIVLLFGHSVGGCRVVVNDRTAMQAEQWVAVAANSGPSR